MRKKNVFKVEKRNPDGTWVEVKQEEVNIGDYVRATDIKSGFKFSEGRVTECTDNWMKVVTEK